MICWIYFVLMIVTFEIVIMLFSGQDILKLTFSVDGAPGIRRSLARPGIINAEEVVQTPNCSLNK